MENEDEYDGPREKSLKHKEFLRKQILEAAFPTIDDLTTEETIEEYKAEFLKVLDVYEAFLANVWGTEGWDSSSAYC